MSPRANATKLWPVILLMILLGTAMAAPAYDGGAAATLEASRNDEGITATLTAQGLGSEQVTMALVDGEGELYLLPATRIDEHHWQAIFPLQAQKASIEARQGKDTLAATTLAPQEDVISKMTLKDSQGQERAASVSIGAATAPTDLLLELPKGRYKLALMPEEAPVERIEFEDLLVQERMDIGVEELQDSRFTQAYAIDPTGLDFSQATVTVTAKGKTLHKCAEWNFTTQTCHGEWEVYKTGLTPGETYQFTLTPKDPAFGETDSESEPDSCSFTDSYGDTDVNCLAEILTQDNGYSADMDDAETTGATATMDLSFLNSLYVQSVRDVEVVFRYQRQTNPDVGDTRATVQVLDGGAYVTACTDNAVALDTAGWETYSCNLTAYVQNETELNNVSVRLITDTVAAGQPKQVGKVYVDLVYLTADYVERDVIAPAYDSPTAWPATPTDYTGGTHWFNVTWTDNKGVAGATIEHNFTGLGLTNTSMSNHSSTYYHNTTLGAGTYVWRSYATDGTFTSKTPQYTYVVNKAQPDLSLLFNGTDENITVNDYAMINITATDNESTLQILREDVIIATGTSPLTTTEVFDTVGVHNITVRYYEAQNYISGELTRTITVIDTIPPGTVTGLENTSRGASWLYWNWTLPGEEDFDHVEVWLNGTFKTNTTSTSYNATGLNADTAYELQVRSVDTHGLASAFTNDTGRTEQTTDNEPPVISNLQHGDITASTATVSWDTDELAGCLIRWGTSSGSYDHSASCEENKLSQQVTLEGLSPSTTYYYRVTATDIAANSATSPQRSLDTLADTEAPRYGDASTQPASPTTYDGGTHRFNVTWTDDVNVTGATIEHNFTGSLRNDSMSADGAEYSYSGSLGAGTYAWRSYATDGTNTNKTPQYTYVVQKAAPTTALHLEGVEGDNTIDEDSQATINATMIEPATGYLYLYYDGTLVAQGADKVSYTKVFDNPTTHNVTLRYAGSQDYEPTSTTYWLSVKDTVAPAITLQAPGEGHIDTDGILVFTYDVEEDGTLENCSLLINGSAELTNTSPSTGSNSFTLQGMQNGVYNWNVECQDTERNSGTGTPRSLTIEKQSVTIEVPATSTGAWSDASTIAIGDINQRDGNAHQHSVPKNTLHRITWTNYTTAAIPPGAIIEYSGFHALHSGSSKLTFQGVKWHDGNGYVGVGCSPSTQTGTYQTDSCDLTGYVDTVEEANDVSLQYEIMTGNLGSGEIISIDYLYLNITYIKETTKPQITSIRNITADLGEDIAEQFGATDNYGVANWTVNDTAFSISDTGLLRNTTALSEGSRKLRIRAYDPSDNYDEENITVTVADVVGVNITLEATGLGTTLQVYDSQGTLLGQGGSALEEVLPAGELYDLVFTTTLTSGALTTTLHDVNLTADTNFTSEITETYGGLLPAYISSVTPIYALDDQGATYTAAELSIPKAGLSIEYIIHCTQWDGATDTCSAWETNETTDYPYAENQTHFSINVTGFDAFGGAPGDTLANLTQVRLYDVTGTGSNRTGGTLINNGTHTSFTLGTDRLYRVELLVENPGKKWLISGGDVAEHAGLNESWAISASDIWYTAAGSTYTGGSFSGGTVTWDLSQGGTLDQQQNGTWYYVFNTTSLPPKNYEVTFTINDTNKGSGSTDTSTYSHVYERELVVNDSSIAYGTQSPIEGENVTINMTVYNVGYQDAPAVDIELWDLTDGVLLTSATIDVGAQNSTSTQYEWTAKRGSHLLELRADTPLGSGGTINEVLEDNNNHSRYLNTSAWHTFYGSVFAQEVLADDTNTFHAWPRTDVAAANIYAADSDSSIDWSALQALTRTTAGAPAAQDLAEADTSLGMSGYQDSIRTKFGISDSEPARTTSMTVHQKSISGIPAIQSTTTDAFLTGILWDAAKDTGDGEYDGTEPLIFATQTNQDTIGTYGTYDYELTIPSPLQENEGATDETYFYVELT